MTDMPKFHEGETPWMQRRRGDFQKILSVAEEQLTCRCPPCRRVNGRAVRKRDVVRKLALRRKVFRNVLVERGVALEFEACRFVWIENGNWLLHPIANCLNRRGKVGVTGDKRENVRFEMLRPGLLPALRRIGSASAGGCNPFAEFERNYTIIKVGMAICSKMKGVVTK